MPIYEFSLLNLFRRIIFSFFICLFTTADLIAEEKPKDPIGNPFRIDSFFSSEEIVSLDKISEIQAGVTLNQYLKVEKTISNQDLKPPISLAVGYLYLKKGDLKSAIQVLENIDSVDFPLKDFQFEFLSQAFQLLAEREIGQQQYLQSLSNLDRSFELRLKNVQNSPNSPFVKSLGNKLAQIERLKAQTYFKLNKFEQSIALYRKALAREFADNKEWCSSVFIELAEVYEAAERLPEAIDIFTMLVLEGSLEESIDGKVKAFTLKHEGAIRNFKFASQVLFYDKKKAEADINYDEFVRDKKTLGMEEKFLNSWQMFSFVEFSAKAQSLLKKFPGTEHSKKILNVVVRKLSDHLSSHSWTKDAQSLVRLLPPENLNELALSLWRKGRTSNAARCYQMIVEFYPTAVPIVNKALFFLGRIFEDKKEYSVAQSFYRRLVTSYPYGTYTAAAVFKIPWIDRIQNNKSSAIDGFKNAISFYKSPSFEKLVSNFSASTTFLSASYYWLAQTAESMKGFETRNFYLKELISEHPFSFYALISRVQLGKEVNDLLDSQNYGNLEYRAEGLSYINRRHLSRAEALISVGFFKYGVDELERLSKAGRDSNGYLFYLATLFFQTESYKQSIGLIWEIIYREDKDMIPLNLAKKLFPQVYWELMSEEGRRRKLDPFLSLALSRQESAFQPEVISSANAVGLMQLLPGTAKEVARSANLKLPDEESLKDPKVNITLGVTYLKGLLTEFSGNIPFALAAYNAGPNKVRSWKRIRSNLNTLEFIESIPYNETRGYVKKVLRNYLVYLALYQKQPIKNINSILTGSRN